jgi:hypothetical protein
MKIKKTAHKLLYKQYAYTSDRSGPGGYETS